MSTPDFSKGPRDPYGPPPGHPESIPGTEGQQYGSPSGGGSGYGPPPGYGAPSGYGQPAGYGAPGGVEGPDGSWSGPPLASWGLRVGGYLIDAVIVGVIAFAIGVVSDALGQLAQIALFLGLGYLNGTKGQTPGKQVVGIKVLRVADGQLLGAGAGIGRQFLHVLDALPFLLGYLWPLWDRKNQTFADKIIGSVVIKA